MKKELPPPPRIEGKIRKLAPHEDERNHTPWSEEEVQFLLKNYKKLGPSACAKSLRRSYSAVADKAWRLGITRKQKRRAFLSWLRRLLGA